MSVCVPTMTDVVGCGKANGSTVVGRVASSTASKLGRQKLGRQMVTDGWLSTGTTISAKMLSKCRTHYLRNNKRGGLKNLRCFPECLPSGHHPTGFCGHSVSVRLSGEPLPKSTIVVGRFSTVENSKSIREALALTLGSKVDKKKLIERIRKKEDPLKEFFPAFQVGETIRVDEQQFCSEFRFSPLSWHYGWRSSKHTREQAHVFNVFVMTPFNKRQLVCVSTTSTSPFLLASSKRAHGQTEPEVQHLVATQAEIDEGIRERHRKTLRRKRKRVVDHSEDLDVFVRDDVVADSNDCVGHCISLVDDDDTLEWLPLSKQTASSRHATLQRLLDTVTGLKSRQMQKTGSDRDRLYKEFFLQTLLKTDLVELSPFGGQMTVQDTENGGNDDIELLKGLAEHIVDNSEIADEVFDYLHANQEDIENMRNIDSMYEGLIKVIGGFIDLFLVNRSDDLSQILPVLQAKKNMVNALTYGQKIQSTDLGLWVLSACVPNHEVSQTIGSALPQIHPGQKVEETEAATSSTDSQTSCKAVPAETQDALIGKKKFLAWAETFNRHSPFQDNLGNKSGRDRILTSVGMPWLARKLVYHMYTEIEIQMKWSDVHNCPVMYNRILLHVLEGGTEGVNFILDGQRHEWPVRSTYMQMLKLPTHGGEYIASFDFEENKVTLQNFFRDGLNSTLLVAEEVPTGIKTTMTHFRIDGAGNAQNMVTVSSLHNSSLCTAHS